VTYLRKPVPDLMKGLAVVTMVQVHIMELFARQEILAGTLGKISLFLGGPFAAPVFMAVMGYFIGCSSKRSGEKMKRGILLILLGLVLNIGLNFHLLIKIFNGTFDLNPLEYIFGADILFLAGFSVIFIALLERMSRKRFFPVIILAIIIPLLSQYLPDLPPNFKYFQAFFYGNASWSYFPVFPWLAYPLVGYGWKRFEVEVPFAWAWINKKIVLVMTIAGILIIGSSIPAFNIITDLPFYYHHHIFLFVWMTGFLIIWFWLVYKIDYYAGNTLLLKYIKWLGENVTVVYVIQWLIIGNIATAIYRTQPSLSLLLWFGAILAGTSTISYFYSRLKISK
jgi:uncharacterized membrane protein